MALDSPALAAQKDNPQGKSEPIIDLVLLDFQERSKLGENKYGEKLRAFNGRNALVDAYQEAMDLVMYLRQAIYEYDHDYESARRV